MWNYDIKQLASHFLWLNSSWQAYATAWLLSANTSIDVTWWEWEADYKLYLRPLWLGTLEDVKATNAKGEEKTWQRMKDRVYEEFINDENICFNINKAIYQKIAQVVVFDLEWEHSEYAIYDK